MFVFFLVLGLCNVQPVINYMNAPSENGMRWGDPLNQPARKKRRQERENKEKTHTTTPTVRPLLKRRRGSIFLSVIVVFFHDSIHFLSILPCQENVPRSNFFALLFQIGCAYWRDTDSRTLLASRQRHGRIEFLFFGGKKRYAFEG